MAAVDGENEAVNEDEACAFSGFREGPLLFPNIGLRRKLLLFFEE